MSSHRIINALHRYTKLIDTLKELDPKAYYAAYDAAKQTHLESLLAKINFGALASVASKARNGISCRIPALVHGLKQAALSQLGGQNCHLDVEFDDGVTWIVGLRLCDPLLPPQPVQDYIFLSEVATLEFLEGTTVPSPRVYLYQPASCQNPVGSSFVLMEKMPGTALQWNKANSEQRTKVMQQLVDIFLELEKYPLKQTGSLVPSDVRDKVGGFAQPPLFETPEKTVGPFTNLKTAYEAMITAQMNAIGNKEVTSLPIDNYLAFRWRLSALSSLASSETNEGPFYLKHYDDKGDHILVDKDFNITGIIDWEFASAEAKDLAFSSPCMMWPVSDYYDGSNDLSADEIEFERLFEIRGRKDISKIVLNGRRWQRFLFFLGGGVEKDASTFESLFQGLRKSFAIDGEQNVSSYEYWRMEAINQYSREDPILQRLLQEEI
ncbi:hypothetical protein N7454_006455 [Penicillium verhagenii]|nr:hypothetical protein N7454_006455 [Penicillium verhagenii]